MEQENRPVNYFVSVKKLVKFLSDDSNTEGEGYSAKPFTIINIQSSLCFSDWLKAHKKGIYEIKGTALKKFNLPEEFVLVFNSKIVSLGKVKDFEINEKSVVCHIEEEEVLKYPILYEKLNYFFLKGACFGILHDYQTLVNSKDLLIGSDNIPLMETIKLEQFVDGCLGVGYHGVFDIEIGFRWLAGKVMSEESILDLIYKSSERNTLEVDKDGYLELVDCYEQTFLEDIDFSYPLIKSLFTKEGHI